MQTPAQRHLPPLLLRRATFPQRRTAEGRKKAAQCYSAKNSLDRSSQPKSQAPDLNKAWLSNQKRV